MSAVPAVTLLAGVPLSVSPDEWDLREEQRKHIRQPPSGRRQQLAWSPPEEPLLQSLRTFSFRWSALLEFRDLLKRILSHPGPHELVIWRREYLAYAGDGTRTDWRFPWVQALDIHPVPPGGVAPAHFLTSARIGLAGPELAILTQDAATYEGSSPAAGELWVGELSTSFKVGAAPGSGETLYVDMVPAYLVIEDTETEATISGPIAEPRTLVLLEA